MGFNCFIEIIFGYVDWMTLAELYQIVTAVCVCVLNSAVFWDVTLCSLVEVD
jgi:hypothetical protein